MTSLSALKPLLERSLRNPGELGPALRQLLTELLPLLEKIAAAGGSLDGLRKPGASPQRPLPPNTPDQPYYVQAPITVHVVNVGPGELGVDLAKDGHHAVAGPDGVAQVTIPAPKR
ncbi:MAG: hypothetical protein JSR82_23005 [Verrucomicrobia bacterium]|nr:hypothetical protein [Verrucomicrobiota bacterium]